MTTALTVDPKNLTIFHIISCIRFYPTHRAKHNFFHNDYVNEINDYDRDPESFVSFESFDCNGVMAWYSKRNKVSIA